MRGKIVAWIRIRRREIALGVVALITTMLSFGFGYIADRTFNHAPIIIEICPAQK